MSSSSTSSVTRPKYNGLQQPLIDSKRRIPVTPTVLGSIFASPRSHEERSISRMAFFRYTRIRSLFTFCPTSFVGFLLSCIGISFVAAKIVQLKASQLRYGLRNNPKLQNPIFIPEGGGVFSYIEEINGFKTVLRIHDVWISLQRLYLKIQTYYHHRMQRDPLILRQFREHQAVVQGL